MALRKKVLMFTTSPGSDSVNRFTENCCHIPDYFLRQMDHFKAVPRGVLAHSTHVRGTGTFGNGVEKPRIQIVLATAIPENQCRVVNLGYLDPNAIDVATWQAQDPEKRLLVNPAGETLYRIKN